MKSNFIYHRPQNYRQAYELKKRFGSGSVYWSGGTDLMRQWQTGAKYIEHCIDIRHAGLDYLTIENTCVRIGSALTVDELASSASAIL